MNKQQYDSQTTSQITDYILEDYWAKKERLDSCLVDDSNQSNSEHKKHTIQAMPKIFTAENSIF
jgi:hypothetical protein